MKIQPIQTLIFILSVLSGLFFIAVIFPAKGLHIAPNTTLVFPKPQSILKKNQPEYADIENIIELNEAEIDSVDPNIAELTPEPIDTIRANANALKKSITRIEFPDNNPTILYPAFRSMEQAVKKGKVVRVLHYGDSQIEVDRITAFLRNKLQSKFGGCGVGLVPAKHLYDFSFSIDQQASDNWYRYPVYGNRDTTILHKRYGLIASFNRFSPYPTDSNDIDTNTYSAWVSFNDSKFSYANTKSFEMCRMFYGYNSEPFTTELYKDDSLAFKNTYESSTGLKSAKWDFGKKINGITIQFNGKNSPEIYAIALDGESGVAVDNIAMRGSSGLVFTKMDAALFRQMIKKLDVKLILLQFGGNVVPNQSVNYNYYERWFSSQLAWIKENAPNTSIIVMGVADMSRKEKNYYVSYESVVKVRNAMKKAAFANNVAYWDMYKAMGGENSMPSWVFANPPLATSDFVHFTTRGAKVIANMFYNALWYEYNRYVQQKNTEIASEN